MTILKLWLVAGDAVLSGAVNGKAMFAELIKLLPAEPATPEAMFIDFSGVEVATASFLRESVFSLKNYLRRSNSNLYPVVCNLNDGIWDEMSVIAHATNDVIMSCDLDQHGAVTNKLLLGSLDAKQQMTFELVHELNEADATSLMKKFGESEKTKTATAWNNRLSTLAYKGILREFSRGRAKFYRPIFDGGLHGS